MKTLYLLIVLVVAGCSQMEATPCPSCPVPAMYGGYDGVFSWQWPWRPVVGQVYTQQVRAGNALRLDSFVVTQVVDGDPSLIPWDGKDPRFLCDYEDLLCQWYRIGGTWIEVCRFAPCLSVPD